MPASVPAACYENAFNVKASPPLQERRTQAQAPATTDRHSRSCLAPYPAAVQSSGSPGTKTHTYVRCCCSYAVSSNTSSKDRGRLHILANTHNSQPRWIPCPGLALAPLPFTPNIVTAPCAGIKMYMYFHLLIIHGFRLAGQYHACVDSHRCGHHPTLPCQPADMPHATTHNRFPPYHDNSSRLSTRLHTCFCSS